MPLSILPLGIGAVAFYEHVNPDNKELKWVNEIHCRSGAERLHPKDFLGLMHILSCATSMWLVPKNSALVNPTILNDPPRSTNKDVINLPCHHQHCCTKSSWYNKLGASNTQLSGLCEVQEWIVYISGVRALGTDTKLVPISLCHLRQWVCHVGGTSQL